ncbi:MAG: preprotein translocase subunit SecY [Sumerlaeia bacterium]
MLGKLQQAFDNVELRKKILYTLAMIAVFRVGAHVPTPFVSVEKVEEFFRNTAGGMGGGVFAMVDMFTGGAFSQMTVMALGIMPYISVQIILQVMMPVVPALEKIRKEGEAGQKKIEQWTRYGTVVLAAFQSLGLGLLMVKQDLVSPFLADRPALFLFINMCAMTAGTTLLMWIGERITAKGVGNGISLIIALGIMAFFPQGIAQGWFQIQNGALATIWVPVIIALCIVTTVVIVLIQEGARKIPIQHAKRTVGRRQTQAQTNYLPLKVNTAGVIPVIFSSAILMLPQTILGWVGADRGAGASLGAWFSPFSQYNLYEAFNLQKESIFLLLKAANLYTLLYVILTAFFCFFYTAITFNPQDVADNLKKFGAFIPGYRPGKQTADYIDMVLTRITTVGAVFLVSVALIPEVISVAFEIPYGVAQFAGGTGLIIVVGVVLDTMKRIESQMLMGGYDKHKVTRGTGASSPRGPRSTGSRTFNRERRKPAGQKESAPADTEKEES